MRRLRGPGLVLEPQLAAHAPELFAILSDPRLYHYLDSTPPADVSALQHRLLRLESRTSPDGAQHWLNWIVRTDAGALVGYVQATIDADHHAEIAYVIGADHWCRGHGAEATRTMITALVADYGVNRLAATVDPGNAASIGLLGRLGFTQIEDVSALPDIVFARAAPAR